MLKVTKEKRNKSQVSGRHGIQLNFADNNDQIYKIGTIPISSWWYKILHQMEIYLRHVMWHSYVFFSIQRCIHLDLFRRICLVICHNCLLKTFHIVTQVTGFIKMSDYRITLFLYSTSVSQPNIPEICLSGDFLIMQAREFLAGRRDRC